MEGACGGFVCTLEGTVPGMFPCDVDGSTSQSSHPQTMVELLQEGRNHDLCGVQTSLHHGCIIHTPPWRELVAASSAPWRGLSLGCFRMTLMVPPRAHPQTMAELLQEGRNHDPCGVHTSLHHGCIIYTPPWRELVAALSAPWRGLSPGCFRMTLMVPP